jgi:hypothetical protein
MENELTPQEIGKLASFLDETAHSEAMLDDIDALYSQLITGEDLAASRATGPEAEIEILSHAPFSSHGAEANDANDEELLVAIDQLYHQMIPSKEAKETQREDETQKPMYMASRASSASSAGNRSESLPFCVSRSAKLKLEVSPQGAEGAEGAEGTERDPSQKVGSVGSIASSSGAAENVENEDELHAVLHAELPVLQAVLEEVLWSALLLARAGHAAQLSDLEELLSPQHSLSALAAVAAACRICPLPLSLRQRLHNELPELHKALFSSESTELKSEKSDSNALLPDVLPDPIPLVEILPALRKARDSLLTFASNSANSAKGTAATAASAASDLQDLQEHQKDRPLSATSATSATLPGDATSGASHVKRRQLRRTSLSHWTEESLEQLEAPKSKGTQTSKGSKKCNC